jgi:hypothetical protein
MKYINIFFTILFFTAFSFVQADIVVSDVSVAEATNLYTTNICDGVSCPDGSCAATVDECVVAATTISPDIYVHDNNPDSDKEDILDMNMVESSVPDYLDVDDDNDGIITQEVSHNSSRSNRTEDRQIDPDDDGDQSQMEWQVGAEPDDLDIADPDDIEFAQDYNSTRSNRIKSVFGGGSNPDGDNWPEATLRAGTFVTIDTVEGGSNDHSDLDRRVVCWGRAEDENGQVYSWGRGLCVAPEVTVRADATARDRIAAMQVRGSEVRAWDEEEQFAWLEYQASQRNNIPELQLFNHIIEQTQENKKINEIIVNENGVEMRYRAKMRLFGIVPIHRDIATRASADGLIETSYPWYGFLTTKPDRKIISSTLTSVMSMYDFITE